MNQNPIFVLGCHKSGTTLLRNLFDGHGDLFVIPTEIHFFANLGYSVKYSFRSQKARQLSVEQIKTNFINWIEKRNSEGYKLGDGFTKNRWNISVLKNYLASSNLTSTKEISDTFHSALYKSIYGTEIPGTKRIVEKSVENSEFVFEWLKLYPNAKFIHIIRNPYSNLVSLRKYISKKSSNKRSRDKFPHLRNPINSMIDSFYDLRRNKRVVDNYLVVRYEDLVTNTISVMKKAADFINIEYDDILIVPTLFSEQWQGNSTRGEKFEGVSNTNLENWKNEITDFEINVVNNLFEDILEEYNYEKVKPHKTSIWKKAPKENFVNYLLNRYLVYFAINQ